MNEENLLLFIAIYIVVFPIVSALVKIYFDKENDK